MILFVTRVARQMSRKAEVNVMGNELLLLHQPPFGLVLSFPPAPLKE